jgi:hypothetical protein
MANEPPIPPASGTSMPVAEVLGMIFGHHVSAVVGTIARLDIAGRLAAGPRTAKHLARATGVDPGILLRLLRSAASLGLLDERDGEAFAVSPLGACLQRGPHSLHGLAVAATEPASWRTAALLHEAVTGDRAMAEDATGRGAWAYRDAHPETRLAVTDRLVDIERAVAPVLREAVDLTAFRRIVAVGGDQGQLLLTLLRLAPQAEGVLFDRPAVIERARESIAQTGLANRIRLVGGDFLERVPPGGDLYVLKGVLHDFGDEAAAWLLDSCYMAAKPNSTLLAFEGVLPPGATPDPVGHLLDMNALVSLNGRERTRAEFEELFNTSGYELVRVLPLPAVDYRRFAMLEGRRS